MPSLTEWYRYVDRVSRPASRLQDEGEPVEWRPWLEMSDPDPAPVSAPLTDVPDLAELLGKSALIPQSASPAREEFEDLTINDPLPAIPVFTVPELHVPSFELKAPRWGEIQPEAEPTEADEEPEETERVAEMGVKGGAASAAARIKASPNWDLLSRVRGEEGGSEAGAESGRSRFRESRQELIERLVDPTLSLEQTAVILGVCPTTVRRYTNKGLLRHFRTKGNQRRFRLSDVVEFMESRAAEIEADGEADRAAGLQDTATED